MFALRDPRSVSRASMVDRGTVLTQTLKFRFPYVTDLSKFVSEGSMGTTDKGYRLDIEPDSRYCRYYLANLIIGQNQGYS